MCALPVQTTYSRGSAASPVLRTLSVTLSGGFFACNGTRRRRFRSTLPINAIRVSCGKGRCCPYLRVPDAWRVTRVTGSRGLEVLVMRVWLIFMYSDRVLPRLITYKQQTSVAGGGRGDARGLPKMKTIYDHPACNEETQGRSLASNERKFVYPRRVQQFFRPVVAISPANVHCIPFSGSAWRGCCRQATTWR